MYPAFHQLSHHLGPWPYQTHFGIDYRGSLTYPKTYGLDFCSSPINPIRVGVEYSDSPTCSKDVAIECSGSPLLPKTIGMGYNASLVCPRDGGVDYDNSLAHIVPHRECSDSTMPYRSPLAFTTAAEGGRSLENITHGEAYATMNDRDSLTWMFQVSSFKIHPRKTDFLNHLI